MNLAGWVGQMGAPERTAIVLGSDGAHGAVRTAAWASFEGTLPRPAFRKFLFMKGQAGHRASDSAAPKPGSRPSALRK